AAAGCSAPACFAACGTGGVNVPAPNAPELTVVIELFGRIKFVCGRSFKRTGCCGCAFRSLALTLFFADAADTVGPLAVQYDPTIRPATNRSAPMRTELTNTENIPFLSSV